MANQLGKGVWHDPVNTGYIMLNLNIPHEEARTVDGITLSPKNEYHCSLVAVRKYIVEDPVREQDIADAVKGYLRTHDLRFAGLGDERYLCRKEDRMTIVAPVRIDGIDEFFAFIQTLIPKYVPPFLHVTLLKSETTEHGISVNSMEDLHRYCEKLTEGVGVTVPTSAYGMHYEADNARVIARAQAVSEEQWNALPINILPARTQLNAHFETVLRRHVDRVAYGELKPDENPTKLWKDRDEKLYIVDGHVHTAIYYALDKPMPVRIMDENSLAELGGDDGHGRGRTQRRASK